MKPQMNFALIALLVASQSACFPRTKTRPHGSSTPDDGMQVYFGSTHGHTSHYSGHGDEEPLEDTEDEHFEKAAAAGHQFWSLTEHSGYNAGSPLATPEFHRRVHASALRHTTDDFVGISGFEYTENGKDGDEDRGHMNIIAAGGEILDASLPDNDYRKVLEWAAERQAIATFNHPETGAHQAMGLFNSLTPQLRDVVALIEVFNIGQEPDLEGQYYKAMVAALDQGWRVSPTCGIDNHGPTEISRVEGSDIDQGACRAGIVAKSLHSNELIAAIKSRRTFATRDYNLAVTYRANGVWMGGELAKSDKIEFDIKANDPDTGDAKDSIRRIEIISEGGEVVATQDFTEHAAAWKVSVEPQHRRYFFVRVFNGQFKDHVAVAAPVWVE